MAFLDKLGGVARNIGDKTSSAIETGKLGSKIKAENAAIAACWQQVGEIYYGLYKEGGAVAEQAAAVCAKIDAHYALIEEAQAEIERIKAESAAPPPPAPVAPPVAEAPVAAGAFCTGCGAQAVPGMKFCGTCGASLG